MTRRLFATAPDGETVPISILHRKDIKPDGTAPLPALRLRRLRHRDAGLVLDQRGCRWSIAASSTRSRISAAAPTRAGTGIRTASSRRSRTRSPTSSRRASICVAEGYARRKIVAHGGSAGGLLMGAIANMRPDLFAGIIAEVPFVDVINTMLDDTLPLTPPEWQEWGNPITDAQAFRTMLRLFALRQRAGAGLSGDPGARRPDRSARDLLGAGEVGREAAHAQHRQEPDRAAHQHGRRPRRRGRALRPAEGGRARPMRSRSRWRARRAPDAAHCRVVRYFCSSSTEANLTLPCGSSASIEPSMNSV